MARTALIEAYAPQTEWMAADMPMVAFWAGVPPNLAENYRLTLQRDDMRLYVLILARILWAAAKPVSGSAPQKVCRSTLPNM